MSELLITRRVIVKTVYEARWSELSCILSYFSPRPSGNKNPKVHLGRRSGPDAWSSERLLGACRPVAARGHAANHSAGAKN